VAVSGAAADDSVIVIPARRSPIASGVERMLTQPTADGSGPDWLRAQHDHSTRCGPRDVACHGSRISDHSAGRFPRRRLGTACQAW
jgi:hypothetical protein